MPVIYLISLAALPMFWWPRENETAPSPKGWVKFAAAPQEALSLPSGAVVTAFSFSWSGA